MEEKVTVEYSMINKLSTVNYLLSERCNKINNLLLEIRDYLESCKEFECAVDIDKLLNMLD